MNTDKIDNSNKNPNRIVNLVFPVVILLILLVGLGVALSGHLDVNEYENRYAEKIGKLTGITYLASEFQDSVEAGLADQLPLAIKAKKLYNDTFSAFNSAVYNFARGFFKSTTIPEELLTDEEIEAMEAAAEAERLEELKRQQIIEARGIRQDVEIDPNFMYIKVFGTTTAFNDHLMNPFRSLADDKTRLDPRISNLNKWLEKYPDIEFNMYYIESEPDMNFETGERNGIYEYLCEQINIPEENKAAFMLNSFAEFDTYFFKSDHHWNYRGSYKAYKNILKWLLPDENPLKPVETWEIGQFHGSKATGNLSNYVDTFTAYEFEYNENITVSINGQEAASYGNELNYINNAKNGVENQIVTYGTYYGQDNGETIFTNPDVENGKILIIGESFDNALLTLLSQHFNTIYSIDQRNYAAQMGTAFSFADYLANHEIDRVLFIGSRAFWDTDSFIIK